MKKSALKLLVFLSDWNRTHWNSALGIAAAAPSAGAVDRKPTTNRCIPNRNITTVMRTILNIE
jgi:hypothetical protein